MQLPSSFTIRYSITAADMDNLYRMTPNAILLYYQDCWARYMGCLHLAAFDVVKQNAMWVISRFSAFFHTDKVFWSDDIEVTVWNSEIGAVRLFSDFEVTKVSTGETIAHGFACWSLIDTVRRRPVSLDTVRSQMPVLEQFTEEGHKKYSPEGELQPLTKIEHKVNTINLDFNGHVNNRTYLSIAMQTATPDFVHHHRIKQLTITWLHETFLGDTLTCQLLGTAVANSFIHNITNNEGKIVAQILTSWEEAEVPDVTQYVSRH